MENSIHSNADALAFSDDQEFPALRDVSTSIDALVDDNKPTPGLGASSVVKQLYNISTSISTSSPIPILSGASQVVQPHATLQGVTGPSASPIIKPALPIVPRKPGVVVAPEEKLTGQTPNSSQSKLGSAKQNEDTVSTNITPVLSHTPAVKSTPVDVVSIGDKAGASGNDGKGAVVAASASSVSTTNISKKNTKEGIKRSPPGKLDIAAATRNLIRETQALPASGGSKSAGVKNANATRSSATPSATDSRPNSTGVFTVAGQGPSSMRSTQPKTLRLVPTPKTETPPLLPSLPTTAASSASPSLPLPSQKPTATALSTNRPATPASEVVLDSTSQASATISRTSSPPPSMTGSGTTRNMAKNVKNQKKKQRKEDKKESEKKEIEGLPVTPVVEEKEIAPIIGRKKKKAKQKGTIAEDSTPSMSRPPSPTMEVDPSNDKQTTATVVNSDSPKVKDTKPDEVIPAKKVDNQGTSTALDEADFEGDESTQKSAELSAASIISNLTASGELNLSETTFFKPIMSSSNRQENINLAGVPEINRKIIITEADQAKLASSLPVHLTGNDNSIHSRVMISPGGHLLRGLPPELEQRFLRLEKSIAEIKPPMAFTHIRHNSIENGFYMVGGRVIQGRGSITANSDSPGTTTTQSNAMSKVRVQEALNYINQFVLPALPTHGKLDPTNNNPFSFKQSNEDRKGNGSSNNNTSSIDTGRAPDPSTYTAYISPVTSSSSTGSSSDVSNVVHGMVAGLAPGSNMSPSGTTTTAGAAAAAVAARGGTLSSVPLLSVEEAEAIYSQSKKEAEGLEKKLNALIKKNKKLMFG